MKKTIIVVTKAKTGCGQNITAYEEDSSKLDDFVKKITKSENYIRHSIS